jgi:hypothetical protein
VIERGRWRTVGTRAPAPSTDTRDYGRECFASFGVVYAIWSDRPVGCALSSSQKLTCFFTSTCRMSVKAGLNDAPRVSSLS